LEYQLKKLTLGITFGLVKGKEPEEASVYNPYDHFVFNLNMSNDTNIHRYKICEKDPPLLEKVIFHFESRYCNQNCKKKHKTWSLFE